MSKIICPKSGNVCTVTGCSPSHCQFEGIPVRPTNHIDQIIEREFAKANDRSFDSSRFVRCYDRDKLRAMLEEAIAPYKKDAERLDWMIKHQAFIVNDAIGSFCTYVPDVENGESFFTKYFNTPREAIDAAMKETK